MEEGPKQNFIALPRNFWIAMSSLPYYQSYSLYFGNFTYLIEGKSNGTCMANGWSEVEAISTTNVLLWNFVLHRNNSTSMAGVKRLSWLHSKRFEPCPRFLILAPVLFLAEMSALCFLSPMCRYTTHLILQNDNEVVHYTKSTVIDVALSWISLYQCLLLF